MLGKYVFETTENGYVIYDKEGNKITPYALVALLNSDLTLNESPKLILDNKSGNPELELALAELLQQMFETFKQKQASYGPGNIAKFGEKGVLVRSSDKLERLANLIWNDKENPLQDETIEDTWLDLAVYACIALLIRKGVWPS